MAGQHGIQDRHTGGGQKGEHVGGGTELRGETGSQGGHVEYV